MFLYGKIVNLNKNYGNTNYLYNSNGNTNVAVRTINKHGKLCELALAT